eukprot:7023209-Pyramimonas_sp.AAC.1
MSFSPVTPLAPRLVHQLPRHDRRIVPATDPTAAAWGRAIPTDPICASMKCKNPKRTHAPKP